MTGTSLTISRLLLNHLNKDKTKDETRISADRMKEALNKATCKHIGSQIYSIGKQDKEIINKLQDIFNIDFDMANAKLEDIFKLKKNTIKNL